MGRMCSSASMKVRCMLRGVHIQLLSRLAPDKYDSTKKTRLFSLVIAWALDVVEGAMESTVESAVKSAVEGAVG